MTRSRLFRTIVVFGTSLGAGTGLVVAATSSGCDLYFGPGSGSGHGGSGWTHIDAGCDLCDAHWGIIDAPPYDGWNTIADAPNDAGLMDDAKPKKDAP